MAFAWISSDRTGSRISGRAGSDLNGVLMTLILALLLVFVLIQMIAERAATLSQMFIIGGLVLVGVPLTLWVGHKDRREADPLVSFFRRVAKSQTGVEASSVNLSTKRHSIEVEVSGLHWASEISDKELFEALAGLAANDFIVLAKEDERYMQVASTPNAFVMEKREGNADLHFQAKLPKGEADGSADYDASLRRAFEALSAFTKGHQPDRDLDWKRLVI
jgi:hypothetical protein